MNLLKSLANNEDPRSLAARLRKKRFAYFKRMLRQYEARPARILDLGGTERFWVNMGLAGSRHQIVLLNLYEAACQYPNISSVVGDARSMPEFTAGEFDIVISNSVIEHLGTFENQRKMAAEIGRVGKDYFVQTPNFFFPIEPHFLFPFFQWFPRKFRVFLASNLAIGWYHRKGNRQKAEEVVDEIRLLKKSEMWVLFPDSVIVTERFMGLSKSFIAMRTGRDIRARV